MHLRKATAPAWCPDRMIQGSLLFAWHRGEPGLWDRENGRI